MKKLYIIHGWTYTIEPWTSTVSILRSWGYEVVQLRVPGLTTQSGEVYDIADYTQWLRGELKNEKDVIVLGHSNGGRIALNMLAEDASGVKKLLLVGSAGALQPEKVSVKRRVFKVAAKVLAPIKHIPLARKVVYRLLGSDYNAAPPNMKKTLANMLASDAELSVEKVTTPTTLLWGKRDTATPLRDGQQLKKRLPHATLTTFPEWGHTPYVTHPYEFAKAIDAAYTTKENL